MELSGDDADGSVERVEGISEAGVSEKESCKAPECLDPWRAAAKLT